MFTTTGGHKCSHRLKKKRGGRRRKENPFYLFQEDLVKVKLDWPGSQISWHMGGTRLKLESRKLRIRTRNASQRQLYCSLKDIWILKSGCGLKSPTEAGNRLPRGNLWQPWVLRDGNLDFCIRSTLVVNSFRWNASRRTLFNCVTQSNCVTMFLFISISNFLFRTKIEKET